MTTMEYRTIKNYTCLKCGEPFTSRFPTAKYCSRVCFSTHSQWKGDAACYSVKHRWVRNHFGRANHCENCGRLDAKKYEWANISHEYKRERSDWQQLCTSCHRKEDYREKRVGGFVKKWQVAS